MAFPEQNKVAQFEQAEEDDFNKTSYEVKQFVSSLPRKKGWITCYHYWFQNFWCQPREIQAILAVQKHFQPRDDDIILATIPKTGTTWLKALTYAIVNRKDLGDGRDGNHPLLTSNPHKLVPFLEYKLYINKTNDTYETIVPDLSTIPSPRLFGTHLPYASLVSSIKTSGCKVVYLCRNPFDTFVSLYHFLIKGRPQNLEPLSIEEGFDMYCKGEIGFGPYWVHMLSYWNESKENPNKVLFLKYEDLKENTGFQVKELAKFIGYPISIEEEEQGVVENIAKLCSFDVMKEVQVNKTGESELDKLSGFENRDLFRKGEVGDWVNYITPSMAEKLTKVMEDKLSGSGLTFKALQY